MTRQLKIAVALTLLAVACSVATLIGQRDVAAGQNEQAGRPERLQGEPLEGTEPLRWEGDLADRMVQGADAFLLRKLDESIEKRAARWSRDFSSAEAYQASLRFNRQRLAHILGLRDQREPFEALELVATTSHPALLARGENYEVFMVRWPVFGQVTGEGLLLVPTGGDIIADIIAIPDADQTPEQIAGLTTGVPPRSQFARRLVETGCRVLVPTLISRQRGLFTWGDGRKSDLTGREFLYRPAFELGRHILGYELQKILAGVDWFDRSANGDAKIGLVGWGEGGMLALYAGALDTRVDAVCVSGYFQSREQMWRQPIDRNVFGLLEQFGDAELATMIAPRGLIVEAAQGPEFTLPPGTSGAPAQLETPPIERVRSEVERARQIVEPLNGAELMLVVSEGGAGPYGTTESLTALVTSLTPDAVLRALDEPPERIRPLPDPMARLERQMRQIERHTQAVLAESQYVRAKLFSTLDTSSLAAFEESTEPLLEKFRHEVIGHFDEDRLSANPRSRLAYDEEKWRGYEVVLDVFPEVFAYGLLLVPKDIEPGERRPVVVCQHGLEGRPQHVIGEEGHGAYKAFAARLADRGFITFAPQNLYIFGDRFRTLQRKANPLGKTLFSIMVPQHQQIVDWLQALPMVDPERIGFYGLSYGGKSAMRIPALVPEYCLSICSADFNEWVDKNASTRNPRSYVWTGEYEIFEFDLGSTFNYAEMAALIAPRPFMVERGHFDGVADDWTVAREYAKVRNLYAARLGIADRTEIEWFAGPHTIHGEGTFDFLHRHLDWPKP